MRSFDACQSICHAAEIRNDENMLLKIHGIAPIPTEAKYRKVCHSKYVSKSNLQYQERKEDNSEGDLYTKAFEKMVVDIQSVIAAGKAYDMTSLLSWYQSLLLECGIETGKSYRSERLKNRLKLHFENNIVFHKQPDPSKPEIVYSSKISLQDVINNASSMSVESSRAEGDFKAAKTDSGQEQTVTLYHASQIIKSDIKNCDSIKVQPLDKEDLCLSKAKEVIPESLYSLLCWVISNPSKIQGDDSAVPKCINEADERRIIMIAQDIVPSATHGRVKTPKHVALGMSVRHITGSNRLLRCSIVWVTVLLMKKLKQLTLVLPERFWPRKSHVELLYQATYHLVYLFRLLVTTMMSTRKPWMERIPLMPQHLFSTRPASLDRDPQQFFMVTIQLRDDPLVYCLLYKIFLTAVLRARVQLSIAF